MGYHAERMREDVHRAGLLKLWREALHDPTIAAVAETRWPWYYDENPAGRPATWLGVTDEGEVIGTGSIYPRVVFVGEKRIMAGVLSDFAVAKAHRTAGCAIAVQRAIVAGGHAAGFAFLFAYPNPGSLAVVKRVGYRVIGETRSFSKPLRTEGRLKSELEKRIKTPWLARGLALPGAEAAAELFADLGLAAQDLARLAPRLASTRGEFVDKADARFDVLWSRADKREIVGEKTSAYLNWRYAAFKTESNRFFVLSDREREQVLGYVVFKLVGNKAIVVDLLALPDDHALEALMLHFALALRLERRDSIFLSYLGGDSFGRRLEAIGFFPRPHARSVIVYAPPELDEASRAIVLDPKRWFMLDGELDI
jgi:RimJ/RimL family protein N-acetyltransferase